MQEFNKEIFLNYEPSVETYQKAIIVTEKLGKLNVRLSDTFEDHKKASRIFAFIESKYSSKIEGIYTTLFDVVNTGFETKQQKLIKPIIDELFLSKSAMTVAKVKKLAAIMNSNIDKSKRFDKEFGIYETKGDKKTKIYQPSLDRKEVDELLKLIIEKSSRDKNIIDILHSHIFFEKIHPFVDANGRLGRLVLQKSLARLMNFSNVIPLSWAFFTDLGNYYSSFDIKTTGDIDKSIQILLDIILKMYSTTKVFTQDVLKWFNSKVELVLETSSKVSRELARDILLTLQTKRTYVEKKYKLNVRTIDKIFGKINEKGIPFNFKKANRNNLYWNIELEEIIEKHFKG